MGCVNMDEIFVLDELKILRKRTADQRKELAMLHGRTRAMETALEEKTATVRVLTDRNVEIQRKKDKDVQALQEYIVWVNQEHQVEKGIDKVNFEEKLEHATRGQAALVKELHEVKDKLAVAEGKIQKKDPRDKLLGLDVRNRVNGKRGVVVGKSLDQSRIDVEVAYRDFFNGYFKKESHLAPWSVWSTEVVEPRPSGFVLALMSTLFLVAMVALGYLGTGFLTAPLEPEATTVYYGTGEADLYVTPGE